MRYFNESNIVICNKCLKKIPTNTDFIMKTNDNGFFIAVHNECEGLDE